MSSSSKSVLVAPCALHPSIRVGLLAFAAFQVNLRVYTIKNDFKALGYDHMDKLGYSIEEIAASKGVVVQYMYYLYEF